MRSRAFFMSLVVLLGGDSMSPRSLTAGDVPQSWNWQPRAASITIERVENEAPRGGGQPARLGQDRFRMELYRLQPQPGYPRHTLSPVGPLASGPARSGYAVAVREM